ncbi:MAG: GNAT family N-acetyltransferase, partial [Planctomycetota bacterium]
EFFLGLIATDPDCRSRGFGTVLLQACERLARERGKDLVRIYSDPRNQRVHRLYERLGYRRAGVTSGAVVMIKRLNA